MSSLRQAFSRDTPPQLRSVLFWISVLYFAQGFPFGIAYDIWPVYFRDHGVSLKEIGLMSLLFLPYTLKPAWAPMVDRLGSRRVWIGSCLLALSAVTLGIWALDPTQTGWLLWVTLLGFTLISATQDISIDAYAVDVATPRSTGHINGLRASFYRVALILSGGLFLLLPGREAVGWGGMWILAALLLAVMGVVVLKILPEPPRAAQQAGEASSGVPSHRLLGIRLASVLTTAAVLFTTWQQGWPNLWITLSVITATITIVSFLSPEMLRWLLRPRMLPILFFVLLFKVGDSSLGRMVKPFWVDRGYSTDEIGLVSSTLGIFLSIAGALTGGWFIARRGVFQALVWMGLVQIVSNFGYVAVALFPQWPRESIYVASVVESFSQGLGTAAFLSFLMVICEKRHGATQYALLSAAFALTRDIAGAFSGIGAETLGYANYFLLTAALGIPAMLLLPWIRPHVKDDGDPEGAADEDESGDGEVTQT